MGKYRECQAMHNRGSWRRGEREGDWNIFEDNSWKLPEIDIQVYRYPGIGSTEGPKQDEPKQTHAKMYHN